MTLHPSGDHLASIALALLISLGVLVGATVSAPHEALSDGGNKPGESYPVRLYVRDRDHLNRVAGRLDIWETHPDKGYVVAAVTSDERRRLNDLGYRTERHVEAAAGAEAGAVLDPRFHYFDDQHPNANGRYVVDFLQDVEATFPNITELIDIGDAWQATQSGEPQRDIWVLRISNESPVLGPVEEKPAFFLSAGAHAREVATPELAIRYIDHLTGGYQGEGGYGVDPDVTWLVDHHAAYVLVMRNPDGHVENEREVAANRRKNVDSDDGCSYANRWGVDLNRNHSFLWSCCGGSSPEPCDEVYRGPARSSEPETEALEAYFATVMADQNGPNGDDEIPPAAPITTTGIFISLHSYGDLVLWPWGFDSEDAAPNQTGLRTIGRKIAGFNGYDPRGSIWYEVDGAADDWAYGTFGIPSFTLEVGPTAWGSGGDDCSGFFPPYECIDGYAGRSFWAENRPALLYAHKIAATPYRSARGPDCEGVVVTPVRAAPGEAGQVIATLVDRRCCGDTPSTTVDAEYFIDAPGENGTGIPMEAADGAWGDLSEEVAAAVDTSPLNPGRHTILVHGKSEEGHWGPFSAGFFYTGHDTYLPLTAR